MDATAVLTKTDAARELLSQRDADLARTIRSFLIMVDGKRTLAQLHPMMDALGVTLDAVHHLVAQGLLHLRHEVSAVAPAVRRRPVAPVAPIEPAVHKPEVVAAAAVTAEAEPTPKPVEAAPVATKREVEAPRSLASAKFYALNLVTLMLVGQDEAPRRAVREANTAQQLVDWLDMCLDLVHEGSGPDRAQLFAEKVWQILPDDARELISERWHLMCAKTSD